MPWQEESLRQNVEELGLQVWLWTHKTTAISLDIPAKLDIPLLSLGLPGLLGLWPILETEAPDVRGFKQF